MRRAAKVDSNQAQVVKELRQMGVFVDSGLSRVGRGTPDLLCGYRGVWLVAELKDGTLVPSTRKLTPAEEAWFSLLGDRAPAIVATEAVEIFNELLELSK